jgi:hypothetical protein
MIGGGIKLELVYTISSGNEDASWKSYIYQF